MLLLAAALHLDDAEPWSKVGDTRRVSVAALLDGVWLRRKALI